MTERYSDLLAEQGPRTPYIVQLLLEKPELPSFEQLELSLRRYNGDVLPITADKAVRAFAYPKHLADVAGQKAPLQHVVTVAERLPSVEQLAASLGQTWDFPDARERLARAKSTLILSDLLGGGLDRKVRMKLFHGLVRAVLGYTHPLAIHWLPSQRLVDPKAYLQSLEAGLPILQSVVNVRVFKPKERGQPVVMDSIGLAAFGLPDVQAKITGVDASKVAAMLYNYADYLFENGDVLEEGHTVIGPTPDERWTCKRTDAAAEPKRKVVELVRPAGPPVLKN